MDRSHTSAFSWSTIILLRPILSTSWSVTFSLSQVLFSLSHFFRLRGKVSGGRWYTFFRFVYVQGSVLTVFLTRGDGFFGSGVVLLG